MKVNDNITQWFDISSGVRQGHSLSPKLLGLFINDLINAVKGDNIQNRATRYYLRVHQKALIFAIQGDIGWTRTKVRHQVAMLRLWNKLSKMSEDCLTKRFLIGIIMYVKIYHMKLKKYLIPLICNRYTSQNLYVT